MLKNRDFQESKEEEKYEIQVLSQETDQIPDGHSAEGDEEDDRPSSSDNESDYLSENEERKLEQFAELPKVDVKRKL